MSSLKVHELYKNVLLKDGTKIFSIVHSLDGYDEISFTDTFKIETQSKTESFIPQEISNKYSYSPLNEKDLYASDSISENAKRFVNILKNEPDLARNSIIMNAAFSIRMIDEKSLGEAIEMAEESIRTRKAFESFQKFVEIYSA